MTKSVFQLVEEINQNLEEKDYIHAEPLLLELLAHDPHYPNIDWNLGKTMAELKKPQFEAYYQKAIAMNPQNPEIWNDFGYRLMENSKIQKAEECYRKTLQLNPNHVKALLNLGYLKFEYQNNLIEAEKYYRKGVELDPTDKHRWVFLGGIEHGLKKFEETERCLGEALKIDPEFEIALYNMGELMFFRKNWIDAELCYLQLIILQPDNFDYLLDLSSISVKLGKIDQADSYFQRTLKLHAKNSLKEYGAWNDYGVFLMDYRGNMDQAEQAFRMAISINPKKVDAWHSLGYLLMKFKKDSIQAEKCFREVIILDPKQKDAWKSLGGTLIDQQRNTEAENCFRMAFQLDPTDQQLAEIIGNSPATFIPPAPLAFEKVITIKQQSYQILKKIGEGGMGAIFQVEHCTSREKFVIKQLFTHKYHQDVHGHSSCDKYWTSEQEITAKQCCSPVRSMHIHGALATIENSEPVYYLLLEYIEDVTLDKWIQQNPDRIVGSTLISTLRSIILPVCRHIAFSHQQGILHLDLTPRNIMIEEDPQTHQITPVVIDWGIAKLITPADKIFHPLKPYYNQPQSTTTQFQSTGNSPEVIWHYPPCAASDIYMLAAVIFHICTNGKLLPFPKNPQDSIIYLPNDDDIPPSLQDYIKKMSQFEPADRPSTMQEVYATLERIFNVNSRIFQTSSDFRAEQSDLSIRASNNSLSQQIITDQQKFCIYCGKKIPLQAIFCQYCGREVESIKRELNPWECPKCGAKNPVGNKFCVICGKQSDLIKEDIPSWERTNELHPWDCSNCGAKNTAMSIYCVVCAKRRK